MPFNFPDPAVSTTATNPVTGATYQWKDDPGKWVLTGGAAEKPTPPVTIDLLPPENPQKGDLWIHEESLIEYAWDGTQWFEVGSSCGGSTEEEEEEEVLSIPFVNSYKLVSPDAFTGEDGTATLETDAYANGDDSYLSPEVEIARFASLDLNGRKHEAVNIDESFELSPTTYDDSEASPHAYGKFKVTSTLSNTEYSVEYDSGRAFKFIEGDTIYYRPSFTDDKVIISDTAPNPAVEGDLWWNSADDELTLYVYYDTNWVPAAPPVSLDGINTTIATALEVQEQILARVDSGEAAQATLQSTVNSAVGTQVDIQTDINTLEGKVETLEIGNADSLKKDVANEVTPDFRIKTSSKTFISTNNNQLGLFNLANPTSDHHAVSRSYADSRYLNLTGGTMTGHIYTPHNIYFRGGRIDASADSSSVLSGRGSLDIRTRADKPIIISSGSTYQPILAFYGYNGTAPDNKEKTAEIRANGNAYFVNVFAENKKLATEELVETSVNGLATETYVDNAVDGLATETYVDNAVAAQNRKYPGLRFKFGNETTAIKSTKFNYYQDGGLRLRISNNCLDYKWNDGGLIVDYPFSEGHRFSIYEEQHGGDLKIIRTGFYNRIDYHANDVLLRISAHKTNGSFDTDHIYHICVSGLF
jgi:hypothetical protein